jgi:hypothetical protein
MLSTARSPELTSGHHTRPKRFIYLLLESFEF